MGGLGKRDKLLVMEGVGGGHQEKLPREISFELRPGGQIRF